MLDETTRRWIDSAIKQVYEGKVTPMQSARVLRTVGQLYLQAAQNLESQLIDRVDAKLERNYQDRQNQRLVDILSR